MTHESTLIPASDHTRLFTLPDGRVLAYSDLGSKDGPVVLLAHGLPGCRLYGTMFHEWAMHYGLRLITPDRPGWGRSTFVKQTHSEWAKDAVVLLDALEIQHFAVLGWSGGGGYATALGSAVPHRARAIALVSAGGPYPSRQLRRLAPRRVRFGTSPWNLPARLLLLLVSGVIVVIAHFDRDLGDFSEVPSSSVLRWEALRSGTRVYLHERRIGRSWDVDLSTIDVPLRIWHGDSDQLAPLPLMQAVAAQIPHAQLTVVPGGHDVTSHSTGEIFGWLAEKLEAQPH